MSRAVTNITACPVCGYKCRTKKTYQITNLVRELLYVCTNDDCGMVFVAEITPVRILVPSAIADNKLPIPLSVAGKRVTQRQGDVK